MRKSVHNEIHTNGSIAWRAKGVRFFVAHLQLYETDTVRKHWNTATKYAKTRRVNELGSGIYALVCGPKDCEILRHHVVRVCRPTKPAYVKALVTTLRVAVLCAKNVGERQNPSWVVAK